MNALSLSSHTVARTAEGDGLRRLAATIELWRQRHRQRHQLSLLDDWQLDDIGINRSEALREARKPFWKA